MTDVIEAVSLSSIISIKNKKRIAFTSSEKAQIIFLLHIFNKNNTWSYRKLAKYLKRPFTSIQQVNSEFIEDTLHVYYDQIDITNLIKTKNFQGLCELLQIEKLEYPKIKELIDRGRIIAVKEK